MATKRKTKLVKLLDEAAESDLRVVEQMQKIAKTLSPHESIVVAFLSEGLTIKEIAHKMKLSAKTVEFHSGNARRKIGSPSIAILTRFAITVGLSSLRHPVT